MESKWYLPGAKERYFCPLAFVFIRDHPRVSQTIQETQGSGNDFALVPLVPAVAGGSAVHGEPDLPGSVPHLSILHPTPPALLTHDPSEGFIIQALERKGKYKYDQRTTNYSPKILVQLSSTVRT